MKATNQPSTKPFETSTTKRAERDEQMVSDFNLLIELDDSELEKAAGGWGHDNVKV